MARIRTIKPEFWTDEGIGAISPNARLLFIASWNMADDEGLLVWSPAFLRSQAFPYDDLSIESVRSCMEEVTRAGFVHPYKDGKGKEFGWIINFRKHQKIDKPQAPKHPLPSLQNPEVRRRYAERDSWRCHVCGDEIPETTRNRSKCLSMDHRNPQARGGLDVPSNIAAAHFGCNASKKDRPFAENSPNDTGEEAEPSATEGKGREQGRDSASLTAAPSGPLDLAKQVWDTGVAFLVSRSVPEAKARSFLGKLRKTNDDAAILAALARAEAATAVDPIPFLTATLKGRPDGKRREDRDTQRRRRRSEILEGLGASAPVGRGEHSEDGGEPDPDGAEGGAAEHPAGGPEGAGGGGGEDRGVGGSVQHAGIGLESGDGVLPRESGASAGRSADRSVSGRAVNPQMGDAPAAAERAAGGSE